MTRPGAVWNAAVRGAFRVLAWLVFGTLYLPLVLPARLWLAWRGRDPLRRRFPAPESSCWDAWRAPTWPAPRRRPF
jgi:hypothetical protein